MRSNLQLNVNDEMKAAAALESIINDSLKTSFKQIDDLMHMLAHKQGSKDGNNTLIEFYKTQKAAGKKAPFFTTCGRMAKCINGCSKRRCLQMF